MIYVAVCCFAIYAFLAYAYSKNNQISDLQEKVDALEQRIDSALSQKCDEKESIRKVRKSVVRIIGGEAEGSGFAFDDKGTILTNFHVIEFEPSPKVILPDNSFESAEILMADKDSDLAFLKIDAHLPFLAMGDPDALEQTDELYAMGFPFGGGLPGELTVKKGILAGKRYFKASDIQFLQTDSTLDPGLSGGPMTNRCGEVVGINTLGGSGMGFAISSLSVNRKWQEMSVLGIDPLKDIKVLDIRPNDDPLHAVQAFYDYIKLRRLDKAFELLGEYKKDFKFENWKKGYGTNLDTTVLKITEDETDKNKIHVKLKTKDFVDGEILYKYYEGYWIVKKVDEKLLLWEAHIKEVKEPDDFWFYELNR